MTTSTRENQTIGRYIHDEREAILEDWEARSREEHPEANAEQRQSLRNSLPEFLERFGQALSSGDVKIPRTFAIEHGIQRWEIGWDIASLARDFMILRRVIVAHLRRSMDIDLDRALALAASLDEAVAESVNAYVASRELEHNKQNEMLERKNYELKRFAHMVSHEIRNPLGLITLAASALKRRTGEQGDLAEQYELIADGRQQIIEVIDNLAHYADSTDAAPGKVEKVELNALFEDAVDNLKYLIEASEGRVERADLPVVTGNSIALRAVFQNLIENALKYCGDEPPRIRVSARRERVDAGESGTPIAFLCIDFEDHGVGIAPKDQDHVFRFLARGDVKANVPGTGVGLALCRRVAEQHGGTLTVESTVGKGSTFTLRLPA